MIFFNKTITSLVTAPINQNVAIIRISGPESYSIINNIFNREIKKNYKNSPDLILGNIINRKKIIIDQVLLLCFYKPFSFTGEDVIEISCHGNLIIVNKILELIIEQGAILAKEGEFTKQAFFNGKLNLIQANAINDLIRSSSFFETNIALHNLNFKNQKGLDDIENSILDLIANIKVNIDYPDEKEIKYITGSDAKNKLKYLLEKIEKIKKDSKKTISYNEGLKIAIIGKPNVGKSTLLNSLLNKEKAIVSKISGTTRDVIESNYNLNNINFTLLDTAGIHEDNLDYIEKIGIKKSYDVLKRSYILLFLVDSSKKWDENDQNIYNKIKKKNYLLILNKSDKKRKIKIPKNIDQERTIIINAKKKELDKLEEKIELFFYKEKNESIKFPYLNQSWQQAKINTLINKINSILNELEEGIYLDAICEELENIYYLIRELSGKKYDNKIIDVIFKKFCLGK